MRHRCDNKHKSAHLKVLSGFLGTIGHIHPMDIYSKAQYTLHREHNTPIINWNNKNHKCPLSNVQQRSHIDLHRLQEHSMTQRLLGQLHLCYKEVNLQIFNIHSPLRKWGLHWFANDLCLISMRGRKNIPQPLVTMCCFVPKQWPLPYYCGHAVCGWLGLSSLSSRSSNPLIQAVVAQLLGCSISRVSGLEVRERYNTQ